MRRAPTTAGADLTGAGATFPYPIYSKWFADYAAKTGVKINYQSIGSGGGIRQLTEGTVDFGASDAPMTDAELAKTKGPVLHVPTVLGAVVITYNVPGVTQPIRLDGDAIADMFLGKIVKWNDPRIAKLDQQRRQRSPQPTCSSCTVPMAAARRTFSRTTCGHQPHMGQGPGTRQGVAVARRDGRQGQRRAWRVRSSRLQERSAMSSWRMRSRTTCRTPREERERRLRGPDHRVGDRRRRGRRRRPPAQHGLPRLGRQRARRGRVSDLVVHVPADQQVAADAVKGKKLLDFVKWALSDGEQSAAALDYAPLPASVISLLGPTRLAFGWHVTEATVPSEGTPGPLGRLVTPSDGGRVYVSLLRLGSYARECARVE